MINKKKGFFMTEKTRSVFICFKNMEKIFYGESFTHNINLCNMN